MAPRRALGTWSSSRCSSAAATVNSATALNRSKNFSSRGSRRIVNSLYGRKRREDSPEEKVGKLARARLTPCRIGPPLWLLHDPAPGTSRAAGHPGRRGIRPPHPNGAPPAGRAYRVDHRPQRRPPVLQERHRAGGALGHPSRGAADSFLLPPRGELGRAAGGRGRTQTSAAPGQSGGPRLRLDRLCRRPADERAGRGDRRAERPGRELVERLRARRPALKVIFMSGYTEKAIAVDRVMPPHTGFVEKPFSVEQLMRRVREILDG